MVRGIRLMQVHAPIEMFRLSNYGTVMHLSLSGDCVSLDNEKHFYFN